MSLDRFAVTKATNRAVFSERIFRLAVSSGSKGARDRASNTNVRSQDGTKDRETGLTRLTPFINWRINKCSLIGLLSMPT